MNSICKICGRVEVNGMHQCQPDGEPVEVHRVELSPDPLIRAMQRDEVMHVHYVPTRIPKPIDSATRNRGMLDPRQPLTLAAPPCFMSVDDLWSPKMLLKRPAYPWPSLSQSFLDRCLGKIMDRWVEITEGRRYGQ